jgi:hypothetical protein
VVGTALNATQCPEERWGQVNPGAKIVVWHKGLVEASYRPCPVKNFGNDEQQKSEPNLRAGRLAHQQESHQVRKGQLSQHIPKFKRQVARANAIKRPAQKQQEARPLEGMVKGRFPTISVLPPFGKGEWHGHSDNEHEERLDKVPEVEAVPGVVAQFDANKAEHRAVEGRISKQRIELSRFPD